MSIEIQIIFHYLNNSAVIIYILYDTLIVFIYLYYTNLKNLKMTADRGPPFGEPCYLNTIKLLNYSLGNNCNNNKPAV